jgi:hypothetical protein
MALQRQPLALVFRQGVDTKTDPKVMQGGLLELENGVFTKIGRLSKRNGYTALSRFIDSSGSPVTSGEGIATLDDELCLLSGAAIYTRSTALDTWVSRGAVTTCTATERQVVRNSYSQTYPCSSTVNGVTVVAWVDSRGGIRCSVTDAETGAFFQADVQVGVTGTYVQTCVFGDDIVIFWSDGANLRYRRVQTGTPATLTTQVSPVADIGGFEFFRVCTIGQRIYIAYGSIANTCKLLYLDNLYTASVAVTAIPSQVYNLGLWTDAALNVWIVMTDGALVPSARIYTYAGVSLYTGSTASLADDSYAISGIVTGSVSTVYISTTNGIVKTTLSTSGSWTARTTIFPGAVLSISDAWAYRGREFLCVSGWSALQATDYVISSDGTIVARLAYAQSGFPGVAVPATAAVVDRGDGLYEIALTRKGILVTSGGTTLAVPGVVLTRLQFGEAPQVSEAGGNLLISGACVQMYDGVSIVEHGFLLFPENTTKTITAGAGSLSMGGYSYRFIYEWTDAKGQFHRSAVSPSLSVMAAANDRVNLTIPTLRLTAKSDVRIVVFRTQANGTTYYRVTSVTAPLMNDKTVATVAYQDGASDTSIKSNELLYTDGTAGQDLENDAPPSCAFMATHRNRVWLGGLTDRNSLSYSKTWIDGEPVSFSEFLRMQVDPRGGDITGLGSMDEKLVIFKERAVFVIAGEGPTNTGAQSDYGDPILVTTDAGCIAPASVVTTSAGLMFQSAKGFYLLDRSMAVTYIGAPVEAYNGQTVTAATLVPNTNQVRFLCSSGATLVYDYLYGQWSTFTGHEGQAATVWRGVYCYTKSDGRVFVEAPGTYTDDGAPIKMRLTTAWVQGGGLEGFQRVYRVIVVGDYKSSHQMRVRLGYDFHDEYSFEALVNVESIIGPGAWGGGTSWGSDGVWGGAFPEYGFRISPARQKCTAIRVSIEDSQATSYGEGYAATGIVLLVGTKMGTNKLPAVRSA